MCTDVGITKGTPARSCINLAGVSSFKRKLSLVTSPIKKYKTKEVI